MNTTREDEPFFEAPKSPSKNKEDSPLRFSKISSPKRQRAEKNENLTDTKQDNDRFFEDENLYETKERIPKSKEQELAAFILKYDQSFE